MSCHSVGFNEAAGIHRRKREPIGPISPRSQTSFNEAAGIHRRKLDGGAVVFLEDAYASMRPPEFTGGNAIKAVRAMTHLGLLQ